MGSRSSTGRTARCTDDPNFRGGARATLGDINDDGTPDVIVSAGFGGGHRVAGFDGDTLFTGVQPTHLFHDFFLFEDTFRNGAYVTVGDLNGDGFGEGGPGGGPRVLAISGKSLVTNNSFVPLARRVPCGLLGIAEFDTHR